MTIKNPPNRSPSLWQRGPIEATRQSISRPTKTSEESYKVASQEFGEQLAKLRALIDSDLRGLEKALDAAGAPWTPGRLPEWREK